MIRFEKLTISGFCAIVGEITIQLNSPGINIIRGRNGIGKSTTLMAFFWVLYGSILKEKVTQVNTWKSLRGKDYSGTMVDIEYTNGDETHRIIRCQNYTKKIDGRKGGSRLIYYINGKDVTQKSKPDTQSLIELNLGISPKLMKASVVFGQKAKRLIKEPSGDKKKVLEEAFKLNFLNDSKDKALPEYKKLESKVNLLRNSLSDNRNKLESTKYLIEQIEEYNKNSQKNIKKSIEDLGKNILNHELRIKKLQKNHVHDKRLSGFVKKYNKLTVRLEGLKSKFNDSKSISDTLKTNKGIIEKLSKIKTTLNTSGDIPKAIKMIESSISALKFTDEYNVKKSNIQSKIQSLHKKIENQKLIDKEIAINHNNINRLNKQIENLQSQSKNIKKKSLDDKLDRLKRIRTDIKDIKLKLKPLEKKKEDLSWVINEALGNKGLKNYIFEYYLTKLNDKLKALSEILGYTVKLTINLDSKMMNVDTVVYYQKDWRMYEELSGGQQQIVDLAIAIGMYLITTENIGINLLWADELFESLDPENIDLVMDLMATLDIETIFIVTHRNNITGNNILDIEEILNKDGREKELKKKRKQGRKGSM